MSDTTSKRIDEIKNQLEDMNREWPEGTAGWYSYVRLDDVQFLLNELDASRGLLAECEKALDEIVRLGKAAHYDHELVETSIAREALEKIKR